MSFVEKFSNCPVPFWFVEARHKGYSDDQLKSMIKEEISAHIPPESMNVSLWSGKCFDDIAHAVLLTYLKHS